MTRIGGKWAVLNGFHRFGQVRGGLVMLIIKRDFFPLLFNRVLLSGSWSTRVVGLATTLVDLRFWGLLHLLVDH